MFSPSFGFSLSDLPTGFIPPTPIVLGAANRGKQGLVKSFKSPTTLSLPSELAARATFFAQLHKKTSVEDWLWSIIQERIDFEEAAFAGLESFSRERQRIK
jgi:hypothetical protein